MASTVLTACATAALVTMAIAWPAAQRTEPREVALIGCVEMEKDYRARMEAGKGGVLGSGVGVSNEFVLTNAKPVADERRQAGARGAVGTAGLAGDYSLTGKLEPQLLRHVGRQVEIVGIVEQMEAHSSAQDAKSLPRLTITLWHPVNDYCPAVAAR